MKFRWKCTWTAGLLTFGFVTVASAECPDGRNPWYNISGGSEINVGAGHPQIVSLGYKKYLCLRSGSQIFFRGDAGVGGAKFGFGLGSQKHDASILRPTDDDLSISAQVINYFQWLNVLGMRRGQNYVGGEITGTYNNSSVYIGVGKKTTSGPGPKTLLTVGAHFVPTFSLNLGGLVFRGD